QPRHIYEFGPFRLDAAEHLLLRDGEAIPLTPKAFDLLLALVERNGHLVEKDELLKKVWPDTFVEEANLASNISQLRKALGDGENGHRYIETAPKRGYRFVAIVREVLEEGEESKTKVQTTLVNQGPEPSVVEPATARLVERRSFLTSWRALAVAFGLLLAVVAGSVRWRGSERPAAISSLAVLPMKPLVARDQDEAFEMGMADTLIFKLSGLKQLIVRPMSAVRKYTNSEQDPLAAGREQQVNFVLDPSLQRDGERILVRARLLNIASGETVWRYECEEQYCANLFVMQDTISAKVVNALSLQLTGADRARMNRHGTENREAYLHYLIGRNYAEKRTEESYRKAIEHYKQALDLDPNYALAYVGLADAYYIGLRIPSPGEENIRQSRAAAEKALEIDETLGEAHTSLARLLWQHDWNWRGAEREFKRAIELDPGNAFAHRIYGYYLASMGQFDQSIAEQKQALRLDPLSLIINLNVGTVLYKAGETDAALAQTRKTQEIEPNFVETYIQFGKVYAEKGMYTEAIAELNKVAVSGALDPRVISLLGYNYALWGKRDEAIKKLDELKEFSKRRGAPAYEMAI